MEFRFDKFAKEILRQNRYTYASAVELDIDTKICELDQEET